MQSFIDEVVDCLYTEAGPGISEFRVLFPSRRARLFFRHSLAGRLAAAGTPLWQPRFASVDEIMEEVSGLRLGDNLRLLAELYKVYRRYHDESFDKFYHWGEMLLADFDAVDNYLIDARRLFVNIGDLKEIDERFDFLSPEQQEVVNRFWNAFPEAGSRSKEQRDFLTIWNSLHPIYEEFREALFRQGFGYKGMIYRRGAERLKKEEGTEALVKDRYAVVGFNALSAAERALFLFLRDKSDCRFFWDYDDYYTDDRLQEAGHFIRQNLKDFPDALPEASRDRFRQPKEIVAVDAPSDALQCRYVSAFLEEVARDGKKPGKETAIVLTNENLLVPVLYSIPDSVDSFNVTSGYDLRLTPAYTLVESLLSLQRGKRCREERWSFYHKDVRNVLNHPYVNELVDRAAVIEPLLDAVRKKELIYVPEDLLNGDGFLKTVFTPVSGRPDLCDYLIRILTLAGGGLNEAYATRQKREYLFMIVDCIHRLTTVVEECGIEFGEAVFLMSLRKMLHKQKIVFEGEPLIGVQVMGILETRNLDFENVLILSVNESGFPGSLYSSSFVPANLRFAYGLPVTQSHEAMYAYYFYRLLQRAKRIHLVYNSKNTEMDTGEPSRFLHQLRYEAPHRLVRRNIALNVNVDVPAPIEIAKTGTVWEKLREYLDDPHKYISPSAFYRYVECPLKFYLHYIAGVEEKEEPDRELDTRKLGNVFHAVMEKLYGSLPAGRRIADALKGYAADRERLSALVDRTVAEQLGVEKDEFSGGIQMMARTVHDYVRRVLNYDLAHPGFVPVAAEHPVRGTVTLEIGGRTCRVTLGGTIDRLDRLDNGVLRIVDYKTGSQRRDNRDKLACDNLDQLFDPGLEALNDVLLQVMTYAYLCRGESEAPVIPTVYFIRNMPDGTYDGRVRIGGNPLLHFGEQAEPFVKRLRAKLGDLFDPAVPFTQTDDLSTCPFCPFADFCKR